MTVKHITEHAYLIVVNHGEDEGKPIVRHGGVWLHVDDRKTEAHAEWSVWPRHGGFGIGFEVTRNGDEKDVGLSLHAHRLGSLWLSLRSPWTKWANTTRSTDEPYLSRHTGLRLLPGDERWVELKIEDRDGTWHKGQPWWRCWSFGRRDVLGRTTTRNVVLDEGDAVVPMPEGAYPVKWRREQWTTKHTRWPGTWLDRWRGPQVRTDVWLTIDGGIPVEGKGENSWDCGMDGLFGIGGQSLPDAIANAVRTVLRDRDRYGGPHDLTRAMTVKEASSKEATP